MKDTFLNINLDRNVSSAQQFSELSASIEATKAVVAKASATKLKGAEAQIESSKSLAEVCEKLEVMRSAIHALLKHNLEEAEQQEIKSRKRDSIEVARHNENLRFTRIAAWAGIIAVVLSMASLVIQFLS